MQQAYVLFACAACLAVGLATRDEHFARIIQQMAPLVGVALAFIVVIGVVTNFTSKGRGHLRDYVFASKAASSEAAAKKSE